MRGIVTYSYKEQETALKEGFDIVIEDYSDAPQYPWYDIEIFPLISDQQIERLEEEFGSLSMNEGGKVIRPVNFRIDARWIEIEGVCNVLRMVLNAIQWE